MGLFDKKYCDVCGEKIGLLGNRKLEDGNLCKNCAKKLSHWFNERRHSSVSEIKEQLAYREENRQRVSQFRKTRMLGDWWKVFIDDNNKWFTVTQYDNVNADENPDIMDFSSIVDCKLDIKERKTELYYKDENGNNQRYQPSRYEYSYNFYITINVNTPYFDEINFCLNAGDVTCTPMQGTSRSFFGQNSFACSVNPEAYPEYCHYRDMGQEICNSLNRARSMANGNASAENTAAESRQPEQAATAEGANATTWSCAACGTINEGKFCQNCGSQKPVEAAILKCASCGWQPNDPTQTPKFCPECGTSFK